MVCPAPTRRDLPAGQDHLRAAAVNFPHTLIFHPLDWSRQGCQNRRFMLPGISCSVSGGCSHRKELFFYGSGFGDFFKVGMAALHGPELPLELFRKQSRKLSAMTGRSFDHYRVKRFKEFCFNSKFTHLPTYRMHPACCLARASQAKRWSCRWHETLRIRYGKYHSTWMQTAMPWVRPSEYQFASVDFTPNYLCSAAALQNINATARDPSELRFIVLMRDPIQRLFSEWSMFQLGWGWDHEKSFKAKVQSQMHKFKQCNKTLYHRPDLLSMLPNDELFAYMKKCFRGMAMEYVTNSLYPVCIAGAMRIFKREQFLFLKFEDLMQMRAPALLHLLSNFTGLYTDEVIINRVRGEGECEAGRAKKVPFSFTSKSNTTKVRAARAEIREVIPELETFYKPYDEMLRTLVHPSFFWGTETHRINVQ